MNEQKAHRIVRLAFEHGVNFFDTGSNYSNFNTEPRLDRTLAPIIKSGRREELVISTKGGSLAGSVSTAAVKNTPHTDFSPDAIEQSCVNSIQRLDCGYIDIFQLHGVDADAFGDPLFDRLLSMRERGLIRHIGTHTIVAQEIEMVMGRADIFDMVLIDCKNLLQLDRYRIIERLNAAGIGVVVGTVLAQSHLVSRKIGSFRSGSFFWYLARTLGKPTTREFAKHAGHAPHIERHFGYGTGAGSIRLSPAKRDDSQLPVRHDQRTEPAPDYRGGGSGTDGREHRLDRTCCRHDPLAQ